jgi:hypothetical protein
MNAINIEQCRASNNDIVISRRAIVKFVYVMIYLYIYALNYKRINAYFNKKADVKVQETVEEQEERRRILPEEPVSSLEVVASLEPVAEVANEIVEAVVPLENDVNTWHTIEDGKCRYKGEWKNGLPNGKGIKHFFKTDSYIDGNFVDGFAEGHGKQTFEQTWEKTVPYYEGEFKRNNYQGKGEYHYGDGDYYKGMWKDGKYHGQGAAYSKRLNKTWVGEYENDEKVEGNWVKGEI